MSSSTYYRCCLSLVVAFFLAATTTAQNASNNRRSADRQHRSSDTADSSQSQNQVENGSESQANETSKDYRLQPRGWVQVATDYDNDGSYDAVETIYYYDLQQARERSKRRSGNAQRTQESAKDGNRKQQFARKTSVQGKITQLKSVKSPRSDKNNVIARVQTSNNRVANLCLGPEQGVAKLDLQKGDQISADGVLTRMNDKPLLLAARITANGESVTHKLTRRKGIMRHEGELVSLRSAESRRGDGQYCVARIDTGEETKTVHLGPKKRLSQLELSEGDEVSVLTRSGKVSGKTALIALQVDANDKTVKVVKQAGRTRNSTRNGRDRRDG